MDPTPISLLLKEAITEFLKEIVPDKDIELSLSLTLNIKTPK
jgi:hypothetical protein